MIAAAPLILICLSAQDVDVWRVSAGLGDTHVFDADAGVVGFQDRSSSQLMIERLLLPFAGAHLGLTYRGGQSGGLELDTFDMRTGITAQWPGALLSVLEPYGRGSILLTWAEIEDPGHTAGDARLIPGLEAAAGLRLAGSTFFAYSEGTLSWRKPQAFALRAHAGQGALAGPATRLGRLNLSGWGLSFGLGAAF